jgi:hypothetical protein
MSRPRFSIASLLAWVALLGLGIAALRSGSPLWANAWFSLAIGALTVAILAAVYRRGSRRAYWVGFASCGWVYMLLALGPWNESLVGPYLVTTAVLDLLYPHVVPPDAPAPAAGGTTTTPAPSAMVRAGQGGMKVWLTGGFGGMAAPFPPRSPWASWTETDRETGFGTRLGGVSYSIPFSFRRIGHSLFCLLAALAGGALTRHLYSTRDAP